MIVALLAAFKLLNLKAMKKASYAMYLEQYDRLDAQLRDRAKDNVPTERQRAGFVSHIELQMVRKKLAVGSKERLLLSIERMCFQRFCNHIHACLLITNNIVKFDLPSLYGAANVRVELHVLQQVQGLHIYMPTTKHRES